MHDQIVMPDIATDVTALIEGESWQPQHSNRISGLGHPCARFLTYCRTHWEELGGVDVFLKGIFQTGNELEPVIERIISRAGQKAEPRWRLVGAQMPIVDNFFAEHQITGTIDGKIQIEFDGDWVNHAAADIKTCSPFTFDRFSAPEDLLRDDGHFGYRWYAQLTMYAFGMNLEHAALIMVNKTNLFNVKVICWQIDYDLCESLVQKADIINAAVGSWRKHGDTGFHPERINRPKLCSDCKVAHICNPKIEHEQEAIFDDAEAEGLIAERFEYEDASKRHKQVSEELKKVLPRAPILIVGPFVVKGTKRKDGAFVRKYLQRDEPDNDS